MSDTLPNEKIIDLVQEQGEMLLSALARIAAGQVDLEIEIPEGIEVMSDLAVAISFLAEDVANRIKTQNQLLEELETRVQERTQELESVVEALKRSQQTYIREEWTKVGSDSENDDWIQSNHFKPAVTKTITERVTAITPVNGNNASALTVPINLADNLIGMLGFEGEELEAISDEDLSAIEDIAEQVGLALENQRLFHQTRQALSDTEDLYQLSAGLNEAETTQDIMSAIAKTMTDSQTDISRLWLVEKSEDGAMWMEIAGSWTGEDNSDPHPIGARLPVSFSPFLTRLLGKEHSVAMVSSLADDPRMADDSRLLSTFAQNSLQSAVFMPLLTGTRLLGLFTMAWKKPFAFEESDMQRFAAISAQVASSFNSLRLLDQTQNALAETQSLYQISARLNAAESVQDLLLSVVETISDSSVDTARFWVSETLADGSHWAEVVGHWSRDRENPYIKGFRYDYSDNPFLIRVLQESREPMLISSIKEDPRTKDDASLVQIAESTGIDSYVYLPLLIGRRLIGLVVMSWEEQQTFNQNDELRYTAIGAQIATAYDSLRSLDQTRAALAETQSLYEISARLNAAESTFNIVSAINNTLTDYDPEEIILWQIRPVATGNGLQITMTERLPEFGDINPKDSFFSYKLNDYPFLKKLVTETQEVAFVSSIKNDPRTQDDPLYLKLMGDLEQESMIYLPLLIGSRLVGLVTLGWQTPQTFSQNEFQRFTAISAQIATANDGLRLLDQTQQALSETQALYQISARLNAAESADEIVKAVIETISGQELDGARLWLVYEKEDEALQIENVSTWFKDQEQNMMDMNTKIALDSERLAYLYDLLTRSQEVKLISSLQQELEEIAPDFLESLKPSGYTSMAFLPLSVGSKIIGLFTFGWNAIKHFDPLEQQYFTAIGAQIATTVEGLRLLEDARLRAAQLEKLTAVETALSAAADENDILYAIAKEFAFARGGLHYIDSDENNKPDTVSTVSIFQNNEFTQSETLYSVGNVNGFLANEIWLEQPNEITIIPDVFNHQDITDESKEIITNMEATAFCVIPLLSGRQWQGIMTLSWPDSNTLSPTELFLLDNLREPLSAIVARHRSQMAAQKARQESEQLYDASRQLNEASSNLNKIVEVVTDIVLPMGYDTTILSFVRKDRNDKAIGIEIAAMYQANEAPLQLEIGQRFGRASYERAAKYDSAFFIEDVAKETELSAISKDLLARFQANSVGLIPLSVGSLEIGYLFLLASETNVVSESNQNLINSLAPQVAVAVQNSLLFDAAQKRADREYLLREISEKVRNTSDVESVMRTAVTEIGRVLGRKTFLYLKSGDDDTDTTLDR